MKLVGLDNNGLLVEVEVELDDVLQKINAMRNYPTGYERMEKDEYYYTYDTTLHQVIQINELGDSETENTSMQDYADGNYYTDEELAAANVRADNLMRAIRRHAALSGASPTMREDGWVISYNPVTGAPKAEFTSAYRRPFEFRFDSLRSCTECINDLRDELIWYFKDYTALRDGAEDMDE